WLYHSEKFRISPLKLPPLTQFFTARCILQTNERTQISTPCCGTHLVWIGWSCLNVNVKANGCDVCRSRIAGQRHTGHHPGHRLRLASSLRRRRRILFRRSGTKPASRIPVVTRHNSYCSAREQERPRQARYSFFMQTDNHWT